MERNGCCRSAAAEWSGIFDAARAPVSRIFRELVGVSSSPALTCMFVLLFALCCPASMGMLKGGDISLLFLLFLGSKKILSMVLRLLPYNNASGFLGNRPLPPPFHLPHTGSAQLRGHSLSRKTLDRLPLPPK